MSSDTSYNTYDKPISIDWNGRYFILTARSEITGNTFSYAYSFDGVHWTKSNFYSNVITQNPYSTKFLGDKFLITGNLITSSSQDSLINVIDGEFPVAIPVNINNTIIYDIERNIEQPHRIVFPKTTALALGNTIAYSNDQGQSWTNISTSPFSVAANDAVWNGKLWVGCGIGTSNTIATSLDGVHWIGRGNYIFSMTCNGIDWSSQQKKYVAVGSGTNVVAASLDGIYWRGTNTTLFSGMGGNDIKWGNGIWVAVGNTATSGNTIAYSSDAITWQYTAESFQTAGKRIFHDDVLWTIYGEDPSYNIATSSDGVHWVLSFISGANELSLNSTIGLFADPSLNLYPGIPYPLVSCATISSVKKYIHNHSDRGSAHIQPISIACGSGANSLAYSIDGIQWTAINTSLFSHCNKAVWNGTLWVVVGTGTYWVATSPDGLCWTGRNNSIMTECYDIAWNGTYFVTVGVGSSLMATSSDGITWTAISSVFTTNIHAIEWTGNVWLAYGSGGNTTAISSSLDASTWSATSVTNLCIVDCSNIILNNTNTVSASSQQGQNISANAFDGSFYSTPTKWSSAGSNYDLSGNYIGTSTTQGISGEWLQVQLNNPLSCKNYYIVFLITDGSAIPQSWSFMGSSDGESWALLDTFHYGIFSPPNNDWKYPFVCLPLDIGSEYVAAYSYYRIVFTTSFGSDHVSVAELALFDSGGSQLNRFIRPIVLKDLVLHPTRVLSVDGIIPNIYRITDLSCNMIRQGLVHGETHVNNIVYGLTAEPSSVVFDGFNHVVLSRIGEVSYLSNAASNTNLNFDDSMNGVDITDFSGSSYLGACYNRKFILLGSSYGVLDENYPPVFHLNNLSSLFTTINGLASNSGYGFAVSSNRIYLKEDERLTVVAPKYHDSALSFDTNISFNVYRSEI